MKSDLYTAIAELAAERNMPKEVVTGAVEHALKTVYKKARGIEEDENVRVELNADTGAITIVVDKEVVADSAVEDPQRQIGLTEARRVDPENGAIGRIVTVDDTEGFRAHRGADGQASRDAEDPRVRARARL